VWTYNWRAVAFFSLSLAITPGCDAAAAGACVRFSDCVSGLTCADGLCVVPPSSSTGDATAPAATSTGTGTGTSTDTSTGTGTMPMSGDESTPAPSGDTGAAAETGHPTNDASVSPAE
jgi:hypothetical protein